MVRGLLLLGLILGLCCCAVTPHASRKTRTRLVLDYDFAEQVNFVRQKNAPFVRDFRRYEAKNVDSLVQEQPGSISFVLRLHEQPVLKYKLEFEARKPSDLDLLVTVESEYPQKITQKYTPILNNTNTIDLGSFSNRIVRLTFSASSENLSRLGGVLCWLDPVLEQVVPMPQQDHLSVEAFRHRERRSNVLVFLFDAASASHVSAYGYTRKTTPVIDSIAADGVLWEHAFTQAVATRASTGTLLTGLLPDVHHVLQVPDALPESFKTMPECFREAGFETALFTANPNASSAAGFEQGFNTVWWKRRGYTYAGEMVPQINAWLDRVRDRQFFGYIHFREPHEPYTPPEIALAQFTSVSDFMLPHYETQVTPDPAVIQNVVTAYDANLYSGDWALGHVIDHLKAIGLFEKTILVIIADHGEAFWGHGKQGHNSQVYEDMIHIPMVMRFPGSPELKGVKPSQIVGTIDLFPTFVNLYQFSHKDVRTSGEDLLPILLQRNDQDERLLMSQTPTQDTYGLRSREFKYVYYTSYSSPPEFYHLTTDPGEKHNVIDDYPILSTYYKIVLSRIMQESRVLHEKVNPGPERTIPVDSETEEQLRALGYLN